eukprot:1845680-Amphidinium_carterae.1
MLFGHVLRSLGLQKDLHECTYEYVRGAVDSGPLMSSVVWSLWPQHGWSCTDFTVNLQASCVLRI